MPMKPIVTVIIPAYNAAEYLCKTIDSVLNQTFSNFEVFIIDDGSSDRTSEIAASYNQLDQRVRYLPQTNQGVSASRNRGIQLSQGEFLAFLDADDQWLPDKLEAHLHHFSQSPTLGISFGRVEFMTFQGEPTNSFSNSKRSNLQPQDLYYENLIITPSNAIIRKAVLEQIGCFDPELSGTEDAELFLRTICAGWDIEGLDRVLVRYRTTQGGVSSNLDRMEQDWIRFSQKVETYAPELVAQHHQRAKAYFLRYLARRAIRNGLSAKVGRNFINRALSTDWTLLLREPRRTFLTLIATYAQTFVDIKYQLFPK